MRVSVTTAPAAEPISVDDAKLFLKVEHTADDALIDALVIAAREAVEQYLGRSLITTTLRVTLDAGEAAPPVKLPRGPVQSVGSFVTYAEDGSTSTVTASNYYLTDDRLALSEVDASTWPTFDRYYQAAYVEYDAGYGDGETDIPEVVRLAIRRLVSDYYYERLSPGMMGEGVKQMLAPYVNYLFG